MPLQLYEVIRVIDQIPLFLEDHLERLFQSAVLNNLTVLPPYREIEEKIHQLIHQSKRQTGNLKISFTFGDKNHTPEPELFFIPHHYPPADKYESGVRVGLLQADRPNPQAKIHHSEIRNKANLIISREKVFEVLLVDHEGMITEGSRSNVFFLKKNKLFTAKDEKVLQGITRKKVVQICMENQIELIKEDIPLDRIREYEGAFLTGSSPKVLPICSVADHLFHTGLPLIKKIIYLYDQAIEAYVNGKKHFT